MTTPENPDSLRSTLKSINAAYESIRQARLDAGVAPGEPLLWPTPADHPDSLGYVIRRASGKLVGPFSGHDIAAQYVDPDDEIIVVNEHGNVIDYGPQFDEERAEEDQEAYDWWRSQQ